MAKVLVIGAQNIDIFAKSTSEFIPHDSNPAKIHLAFGGVGRNIAENLCRLGNEVHFISVFGDDIFSEAAHKSLIQLGVNTTDSLFLKNQSNSVYLGILDQENDLFLGLNDMEISKALDPTFLKTKTELIRSFELLVLDNNLETETLHYLLNTYQDKILVMDAVSAKKAMKLKTYLDKITVLKLNQIELNALSSETEIVKQLKDLHNKGAKTLLITNKDQEISLSNPEGIIKKKPLTIDHIVNATGAGDAFLSGFIHGMLHQFTDDQKLNYANRVAHITLKSNNSTSE
ncbi:MAG: carbohydrate kinase family protein, partial [Bacteroidales bacterium]|nr:carbohydrate kinase family protein [Bacteroidales bacterium]